MDESTRGRFRLQNEKVRIYHLAHELDMESKALLDLCRKHGLDVKNQLSTLTPEQRDAIVALVRKGRARPLRSRRFRPRCPSPFRT